MSSIPFQVLNQFSMADDLSQFGDHRNIQVDILIGLDQYWSLVSDQRERHGKLVAQHTSFGWLLSGTYGEPTKESTLCSTLFCLLSKN